MMKTGGRGEEMWKTTREEWALGDLPLNVLEARLDVLVDSGPWEYGARK